MFCSRKEGHGSLVYFDCNATTPTLPLAADAAWRAMRETFGNPSSVHTSGLQARQILLDAHEVAARVLRVTSEEIVFTSGATEGIQMAVVSALSHALEARRSGKSLPRLLLYGATEHKAVPQALQHWNRLLGLDFELRAIPVLSDGTLDLEFLRTHAADAWFVATMAVNNETGVFQDLGAVRHALRGSNPQVLWMVDCVQGLGKMVLDFTSLDADYAVFSGHKLYAPKGIGFFYFRKGAPLVPLIVGGGQERGLRSGTENIPGVAAILEVLKLLDDGKLFLSHAVLEDYRRRLAAVLQEVFPDVVFNALFERSVPTCLNFSVPGFASREILDAFDAAGVRVSAGSACSATRAAQSHVLDAMGFPQWRSAGAVRLSFGPATDPDEIESGIERIRTAASWLSGRGRDLPGSHKHKDLDGVVQYRDGYANSWAVVDASSQEVVLIDPWKHTLPALKRLVKRQDLLVRAVLFTHHHGDERTARRTWLAEEWPEVAASFVDVSALPRMEVGSAGEWLPGLVWGEHVLVAVPTPGHTDNDLTFLVAKTGAMMCSENVLFAFVGDSVLTNGLGRSDGPGASPVALHRSLQRLNSLLGAKTILCPTHDYTDTLASSWEAEKRWNPLLEVAFQANEMEFAELKSAADGRICDASECAQWATPAETDPAPWRVSDQEMSVDEHFLERSEAAAQVVAIDVRESYEHVFLAEGGEVRFESPLRNVPLSRFANFMAECVRSEGAASRFVFVCRSGGRALQAARSFRLLGYDRSWSLSGGVACGCPSAQKT